MVHISKALTHSKQYTMRRKCPLVIQLVGIMVISFYGPFEDSESLY